jgi:hypothetical protein
MTRYEFQVPHPETDDTVVSVVVDDTAPPETQRQIKEAAFTAASLSLESMGVDVPRITFGREIRLEPAPINSDPVGLGLKPRRYDAS